MRLHIQNTPALDLCHATSQGWEERVNSLLALGVNPNAHFDAPETTIPVLADEEPHVQATSPPQFAFEVTEMPALRLADRWVHEVDSRETCDLAKTARLMTALLKHGADPWALFRQPVLKYRPYPVIPGDYADLEYEDNRVELTAISYARRVVINETLRQKYDSPKLIGEGSLAESADYYFRDPTDQINYEACFAHIHGTCSVLHSLIEAGSFIQPIIDFLGDSLDVEQRDPQGRTLFLAACRSYLGLDGALDGFFMSLRYPEILPNPYPRQGNPWQETGRFASACTGPTLLEFFVSRGADLHAVDKFGQNALHHLFAFIDRRNYGIPPLINTSLKYLLRNCPSLINQPDSFGIYPIHYAIRRMRDFWTSDSAPADYVAENKDLVPRSLFHLEKTVYDLFATGADPLIRDGRGNTVLHYLAASKLGVGDRAGNEHRRLLPLFLGRGVDPRARNADNRTALEVLFLTRYERWFEDQERDYDQYYAIGREIVDAFEKAGYLLAETNGDDQNLLHHVAQLDSDRARPWFDLLQARGIPVDARDNNGETPLDIAKDNQWIQI